MSLKKILKAIEEANTITITAHVMPDGDCIGSSIALYHILNKLNKKPILIIEDKIPKQYNFLVKDVPIHKTTEGVETDIVIILDCGAMERASINHEFLKDKFIINIDHHISNNGFGNISLIEPNRAAVGEIIYEIALALNIKLDIPMAEAIYTSISTDTGHLQYTNTTANTYEVMKQIAMTGLDMNSVYEHIYCNTSKEKIELLSSVYKEIEYFHEGQIALVVVTKDMLSKAHAIVEDAEGVISTLRDIDGVKVAVYIKELDKDEYKIGLRSKGDIDVAFLSAIFGGGGHIKAAGCSIKGDIKQVKCKILEEIFKVI